MTKQKQDTIGLRDIAGYRNQKAEALKIIDMLRRFKEYKSKGVDVPKGLLIYGEPGIGKTMLSKAIANESGVPLITFGAQDRTSQTLSKSFADARKAAPSILLIDELDELVPGLASEYNRAGHFQSDESRDLLKTLLMEIDATDSSLGVLVIGTACDKTSLPVSLIRSGRLGKHIVLDSPTISDRRDILTLYLRKAGLQKADPKLLAQKTSGCTAADLKQLVDDASSAAVRIGKEPGPAFYADLISVIKFGEILDDELYKPCPSVAWHEIGHFLCRYGLSGAPVSLSIKPQRNADGYMEEDEEYPVESPNGNEERETANEAMNSVIVGLGGIAGETVFTGKRYLGSTSDISQSISIINKVLANGVYGFDFLPDSQAASTYPYGIKRRTGAHWEKTVALLKDQQDRAIELVRKHEELGKMIFPILMKNGFIPKEELQKIVAKYEETVEPSD